ncbi:protein NDUFAF4 homolog [Ctenocephalides felis]|uniref:protein NDUFAF4 homolog n=1 Tax=Ctenocephalides felis TaxID=7515 RepID=UPI000E6E2681|nr:protein NDUFAF4 homolog [Ctenocephalides felis]
MGTVLSAAKRSINKFNIEERAHKVLSKEKPTPAPKHPKDVKIFQKALKENPESSMLKQHTDHDERLKHVYLESYDVGPDHRTEKSDPSKPLPLNRSAVEPPIYGFHEPNHVPYGKCTLKQAIEFIEEYNKDKQMNNANAIANKYKLSEETTSAILEHFRVFQVYVPPKLENKSPLDLLQTAEKASRTIKIGDK